MEPVRFANDEGLSYRFVDWAEMGELTYRLAKKIITQEKKPFDRVIALATGGLTMSRALKDYLEIPKHSTMQVSFYTGIGVTGKMPIITQAVPADINGERILIFDDINDTGGSLRAAKQYCEMRGAREIVTATQFEKPHTRYPSDYYGKRVKNWLLLPDEIREMGLLLTGKWSKQGLSEKQIERRLHKIGFSDEHLAIIRGK